MAVRAANPPTLALGLMHDPARGRKDTARNILDTGEFVVNLVPRALAEAMNVTAIDAPAQIDELALAGLSTLPGTAAEILDDVVRGTLADIAKNKIVIIPGLQYKALTTGGRMIPRTVVRALTRVVGKGRDRT